jgi:hypothetical protein
MATAELRIVHIFDDGGESDLAVGTIDHAGTIAVDRIAPGQEARVGTIIEELNGSERLFDKQGSDNPGSPRHALVKRAVERGMPGFLDLLVTTARRFYGVDLRFDRAVLGGALPSAGARAAPAPDDPDESVVVDTLPEADED